MSFPLVSSPQSMNVMITGSGGREQENVYVWQKYSEMTGVDVNWTTVTTDTRSEAVHMGGTITCESELGHGTTFTVVMHMKYADESQAQQLLTSAERPHGAAGGDSAIVYLTGERILLVEDNAMNGYEATGAIRSMDRADAVTVPIYAMTANTFDEDVRQVKDAGMNGHIGKPYTPETLYTVLAHVFG